MRKSRGIAVVLALAVATLSPAITEATDDSREAMKSTVDAVRETGVRMYAWLQGWLQATNEEIPTSAGDQDRFDWSECTPVSATELVEMIGGDGEPILDGWGNPLEYCAEIDNLATGRHLVGVRSAGSNGRFGGPVYDVGPFDETTDSGTDIVWMDGYFLTWPKRPPAPVE